MTQRVGEVTRTRYTQIAIQARALIEQQTKAQFQIGDWALEIVPMRPNDQQLTTTIDDGSPAAEILRTFAETIGISFTTLETYREVSDRWPKQHRQPGVSHDIHRVLADRDDRFELIAHPPVHPSTGEGLWRTRTIATRSHAR